jgi:predicted lipase
MCDYPGLPGSRVHRGFWTATDSVFREHHERFPRQSCFARRITFLGHSLGGACATLAAHMLCRDSSHVDVVTFGCPRVGDGSFVRDYNARVPDTIRIVHDEDDIPRLPPEFLGYEHVDGLLHLYDGGIPRNRLHAIWDWITAAEKRVIADVDGEGIRDHFMQRYIDTVKLYDVRQECA